MDESLRAHQIQNKGVLYTSFKADCGQESPWCHLRTLSCIDANLRLRFWLIRNSREINLFDHILQLVECLDHCVLLRVFAEVRRVAPELFLVNWEVSFCWWIALFDFVVIELKSIDNQVRNQFSWVLSAISKFQSWLLNTKKVSSNSGQLKRVLIQGILWIRLLDYCGFNEVIDQLVMVPGAKIRAVSALEKL